VKSQVPKEERAKLVEELYAIITGRVKDFVLKHDAVRAIQTAIRYASPDQRKQIARELQGTYAQLAEGKYSKFLIAKLMVQNDDEIRDLIIPEFYGKVRRLINHPEGGWILDDIYRGVATKAQKATLLREWYGPEFALFGSTTGPDGEVHAELRAILEAEPSKRPSILRHLMDMANGLIQKQMTAFTMLHDAMLQYFLNVKPDTEEQKEFLEVVKGDEGGDLLKNLAFTRSGVRLVCLLLAHGNAKDRRQLLRTYKDTFQAMCGDKYAHIVILAAYDLIDDTVLTSKTILPEILGKEEDKAKQAENIEFCTHDLNARTTILYLLEGASKNLFPDSHALDLEILAEIHEIRKTTSKKDDETRRKELIIAASPQLLSAIVTAPRDLVSTSFGCQMVTDVLLSAVGDKSEALDAIAVQAGGDPNEVQVVDDVLNPPYPHISQSPFAAKMLKTLIAGGRFDKRAGQIKRVDPPLRFGDILYSKIKDQVVSWATGPSSFVLVALLEADDFAGKQDLVDALSTHMAALKIAATTETAEQKRKRVADDEAAKSETNKKRKGRSHLERTPGNAGTRLLLEKL
jgi:pumilio homology domain family member 6